MLSVIYAERHIQVLYAECHFTECHFGECRQAKCRGTQHSIERSKNIFLLFLFSSLLWQQLKPLLTFRQNIVNLLSIVSVKMTLEMIFFVRTKREKIEKTRTNLGQWLRFKLCSQVQIFCRPMRAEFKTGASINAGRVTRLGHFSAIKLLLEAHYDFFKG